MATSEAQKGYIYKGRERARWRREVNKRIAAQAAEAKEARDNE